jgi:hypothetical protein
VPGLLDAVGLGLEILGRAQAGIPDRRITGSIRILAIPAASSRNLFGFSMAVLAPSPALDTENRERAEELNDLDQSLRENLPVPAQWD